MFHIHRFTEMERVYAPPNPNFSIPVIKPKDERMRFAAQLAFGFTTILSSCCICGKLTTVEVLGDARKREDLPQ